MSLPSLTLITRFGWDWALVRRQEGEGLTGYLRVSQLWPTVQPAAPRTIAEFVARIETFGRSKFCPAPSREVSQRDREERGRDSGSELENGESERDRTCYMNMQEMKL